MNTRNKKCLCGSGKKSKNCCENEAKKAAQRQIEWKAYLERCEERRIEKAKRREEEKLTTPPMTRRLNRMGSTVLLASLMAMMHSPSNYKKL